MCFLVHSVNMVSVAKMMPGAGFANLGSVHTKEEGTLHVIIPCMCVLEWMSLRSQPPLPKAFYMFLNISR